MASRAVFAIFYSKRTGVTT